MRSLCNHKITILLFLLFILLCQCQNTSQKENTGIDLINWYNNNDFLTRTIKNGCWSDDENDAPTDKELEQILDTACKVQTAVNWNEFFFLVVRDPAEQEGIVGDRWGKGATTK